MGLGWSVVCSGGFHLIICLAFCGVILLTLIFKNNLVLLKAGLQECTASGVQCAPWPALGFRVILSPNNWLLAVAKPGWS